uniref:RNA polymerase sigma factor n=1 Tax=Candidatus Cryptobacteroides bacterium TaxID=3085639 RepID=UPI004029EC0E
MTEEEKSSRNLTEEEFGRIFSRCRQMFVKIANSYVHDDSAAEDIVNECFIRMWEKRDELKTENYESYAFKSIVHRCLAHIMVANKRKRIQKHI